jgi:thiol-disulfide isomerase/thioredoxin
MNWNMLLLLSVALIAVACTTIQEDGAASVAGAVKTDQTAEVAGDADVLLVADITAGDVLPGDGRMAIVSDVAKEKFMAFDAVEFANARESNKTVVLFFYASWCPLCREEEIEARAAFDELVGSNVVGFRVNFKDSETDAVEEGLAREFGIAYQHTKIILKNGKQITKAPDSWDKQRYLLEIAKV